MTVLEMYEKANLIIPLSQRDFISRLNDTMSELCGMYDSAVNENSQLSKVNTLYDSIAIRPLYHIAIVDNILFLSGAGETYKVEFLRKADIVNKKYWSENARGRKVKRERW